MARQPSRPKRARDSTPGMGPVTFRLEREDLERLSERAAVLGMSRGKYARHTVLREVNDLDSKQLRADLLAVERKVTNLAEETLAEMRSLRRAVEELTRAVTRFMRDVEPVDS